MKQYKDEDKNETIQKCIQVRNITRMNTRMKQYRNEYRNETIQEGIPTVPE